MKHLAGRASSVVSAPIATCFTLLESIERYPRWSGEYIRDVTDVERDDDGRPVRAHVVVHVAQSPFGKYFEFDVAIRTQPPRTVNLIRLPSSPSDLERLSLSWSLSGGDGTRIEVEFGASVSFLPGFLPLPGVGELIAGALLDAATRELCDSTAPAAHARSSR
jgi:hypothetical protein